MQTRVLKILFIVVAVALAPFAQAQPSLKKADSLFQARQYTQSFDLYKDIFQTGWISPAMLLRMAYIQEGLGHISQSIYYLQLYHQASNDETALEKIEELAEKNKLEGYAVGEQAFLWTYLARYELYISGALAALCLLFLAMMVAQKRKKQTPMAAGFGLLFFLVVFFAQINFSGEPRRGIVARSSTYLMSGPSASSSVVAIIDEGHQLKITGKKDVWLRVEWQENEAYIKEDKLLKAAL